MQSPVKKIYITQVFGVNKANYIKFGLQGHNGEDFRAFLPNGERCYEGGKSEVFSPHDGEVIENVFDANGYGWYTKIENDIEGSLLGHFSSQSPLLVGTKVKEGQLVGYQGTTGNSTGIHLHWGYYRKPRDRNNGFNGYINQSGMYSPYKESMSNMYKGLDLDNKESMKVAVNIWDEVMNQKLWVRASEVDKILETLGVKTITEARAEIGNRLEQISRLKDQVTIEQNLRIDLSTNLSDTKNIVKAYENNLIEMRTAIDEASSIIGANKIDLENLKEDLTTCQNNTLPVYVETPKKWHEHLVLALKGLFPLIN